MTKENFLLFEENLKKLGYKKYSNYINMANEDYYWCKPFGKSELEPDRSNYQILFCVYDFSKYANKYNKYNENPYQITSMIMVSRTINERIDLTLNKTDIDIVEDIAKRFFDFVTKNI